MMGQGTNFEGKLFKTVLLSFALSFSACGSHQESGSDVKVTNGRELKANEKAKLEAVVPLSLERGHGLCTGTFISQEVVLTAQHCVDGSTLPKVGDIEAVYIVKPDVSYIDIPQMDVALLVFPKGTAAKLGIKKLLKISASPVREGEEVTLVGYGRNNMHRGTGTGPKRIGTNRVDATVEDMIVFASKSYGPGNGEDAGAGSGDSGGPLLNSKGEVVGVAVICEKPDTSGKIQTVLYHLGFGSDYSASHYVDVNGKVTKLLLKAVSRYLSL
jgi:hypothetical protein